LPRSTSPFPLPLLILLLNVSCSGPSYKPLSLKFSDCGAHLQRGVELQKKGADATLLAKRPDANPDLQKAGRDLALNMHGKAIVEFTHVINFAQKIQMNWVFRFRTLQIAHLSRGRCYFDIASFSKAQADWDKAIEDFTQSIQMDPGHHEAYFWRGFACLSNLNRQPGEVEKPLNDLNKAIVLAPIPNPYYFWLRATIHLEAGQKALAEADKKKFKELRKGK